MAATPVSLCQIRFQQLRDISFYLYLIKDFVKGTYAEFYQLLFQCILR